MLKKLVVFSLLPWFMHADDKSDWIMPVTLDLWMEMGGGMRTVTNSIMPGMRFSKIQEKWEALRSAEGSPQTLDEAKDYINRGISMIRLPAVCTEYDGVFFFSGTSGTSKDYAFSSGLAMRKGDRTIFMWNGIDWDEEFPKGPQPAKVVARLGGTEFKNKQFPGYFQNSRPANEPVALGAADCLRFMDWVLERQKEKVLLDWTLEQQKEKALQDWGSGHIDHDAFAQEWKRVEALPPEKLARYIEAMRMIKLKPERVDLIDETLLKGNRVEDWPWVGDMNVIDASIPAADDCWLKGGREDWLRGVDMDDIDASELAETRFDLLALEFMRPQMRRLLLARKLREKAAEGAGTPETAWQKWELWCLGQVKSAEIVFEDAAFQKDYEAYLEAVEKSIQKRVAQKKPFWRLGGN